MASVSFKRIRKQYGDTIAVDDVDLDVRAGEFCSLVGPSGCGKTTLLRIAAGFVEADAGEVLIAGKPSGILPPNRRNLGFVFQSYALFPTKTVAQNIGFSLALKRVPRTTLTSRVAELCHLVALEGLEDRFPHELSGGQQQRVALARALISEPPVLLLDEPLSALDAKIRAHLRVELRRIVERLGVTAIYVTHDQEEALSISDRVAIMKDGRILQVGTPTQVYLEPTDPFVADFVGSSNMLACTVLDRRTVEIEGIPFHLRADAAAGPGRGSATVRPEHVVVIPGDAPADGASVPARLLEVSFQGPTVRLGLVTDGGQTVLADVPNIDWAENPIARGAAVRWSIRDGHAVVFATPTPPVEAT